MTNDLFGQPQPIRMTVASACRTARLGLGMTLRAVAATVGVSPAYIWAIEHGRANPSLDLVVRIAQALDLELGLTMSPPVIFGDRRQRDGVHSWASGYIGRRTSRSGLEVAREVEIVEGRYHGWIDLLAFDRRTGTLIVIEVKTQIDDLGAIERQVGWYERRASYAAQQLGWSARRTVVWLLVLATEENERRLRLNRDALAAGFRVRQPDMQALLTAPGTVWPGGRGVAMVDPASRRTDWLIRPRLDGRRSAAPYADYRSAAARMSRS